MKFSIHRLAFNLTNVMVRFYMIVQPCSGFTKLAFGQKLQVVLLIYETVHNYKHGIWCNLVSIPAVPIICSGHLISNDS